VDRKIRLCCYLSIGLCFLLSAESIQPGQLNSDAECGRKLRTNDVLVLNLEHLRRQPEMAQEFVDERAGQFRLLSAEPEEIRTPSRPSKDPDRLIRGAQKLGAKMGCDLVLVLKTGPYFGRQGFYGRNGNMRGRIRERGYAFVVVGQRTGDKP